MSKNSNRKLKHHPYNRLKGVLAERGLTQKYLAELLGVNPATINQKINGYLEFSFSEVEVICDDLGISTEIFRGQKVA